MTKEELTTQAPQDVTLQKCRASLIASGGAMVMFALWTVLRSIVQIDQLNNVANSAALKPLIITVAVASLIDLVLKLYVGLSARVEGLGRGGKRPYLILGIIIAIFSLLWVIYMLVELPAAISMYGLLEPVVTLVVEATVLYAALDLVFSARKVRKLEEEMGRRD